MTIKTNTALALGLAALLCVGAWLAWSSSDSSPRTDGLVVEKDAPPIQQDLTEVGDEADREALGKAEVVEAVEAVLLAPQPKPRIEVPTDALPAGQLEVLVLLDGTPVDSGQVHVFDGGFNAFPRDFGKARRGMFHAFIGADGWARFQGMPGGFLNIAAEVEPGYCQYLQPTLNRDEGTRVVIRLESTRITGRVYDEHGTPVHGAMVFIDGPPESPQSTTWTDAQGAYSLAGMPAGPVEVTATRNGHFWVPAGGERREVTVEPGRTLVLDFGSPDGWPRLTGAVRNAAGEKVRVAALPSYRGSLILRERERSAFRQVRIANDGSIDIGLEPGTYEVSIQIGSNKTQPVLEEALVMNDRDLRQDLVIPGAIVRGRLRKDGANYEPGEGSRQSVGLHDKATRGGPADYSGNVDREGAFVLSGLQPGTYRVTAYPMGIADDIELEVLEGDTELVLDLDLVPHKGPN